MATIKINLSCEEADILFPGDEDGQSTETHSKDAVENTMEEFLADCDLPQFHGFSDWVYYNPGWPRHYSDRDSGYTCIDVAKCKATFDGEMIVDVLWRVMLV